MREAAVALDVLTGAKNGQNFDLISDEAIAARGFRSCPVGSAACGFSFDELSVTRSVLAEGAVEQRSTVAASCDAEKCGAKDESLSDSLGRLSNQQLGKS